jgi:hypothetical protein
MNTYPATPLALITLINAKGEIVVKLVKALPFAQLLAEVAELRCSGYRVSEVLS